jgi:hypothetical protein
MQHGYIEITIEGVKHAFYFPLGLWSAFCIKHNVGLGKITEALSGDNPNFLEALKDVLLEAARYNAKRLGQLGSFTADSDDAFEWLGGLMREDKLKDVMNAALKSLTPGNVQTPKEAGNLQVTK